jgi:hypothetical protein
VIPQSEDNSPMVSVFFYGLFMDADALRSKGFHPTNERQARLDGMALHIGQRATLTHDPSKSAHGFVIDLSRRELDRLYAEPSVASYRPEIVSARLTSGHSIAAVCYNLPIAPEPTERNPEYAAKVRELGRRLGLPAQYVESIA